MKNCVRIDRSFMLEQIDPLILTFAISPIGKDNTLKCGTHQNKLKENISVNK